MRFAHRLSHTSALPNDVQVRIGLPYALLYRAGARIIGHSVPTARCIQIFQEHPSSSVQLVERYLAAFPHHMEAVTRYLAHGGQFSAPQVITYVASSYDDAGRLYATIEGAQRLPRQLRLLLFGATHVEIDIAGAFYEIVRRTMIRDFPSGIPFPTIQTLRTALADVLPLNLSHDQFLEWMNKQSIDPYLLPLRNTFRALRDQAETIATCCSRTLREGHFRGRGQVFCALECIELQLTLRMIDLLTQHSVVSSVIWLHDGIWVAPAPDTRLVQAFDQHICKEFGIYTGQALFTIKNLEQLHETLVSQLPNRRQPLRVEENAPIRISYP